MTFTKKRYKSKKEIKEKKNKKKRKSYTQKKKKGGSDVFLNSLLGNNNHVPVELNSDPTNLECFRKKYSNIQHCIDEKCIKKMLESTKISLGEESRVLELEKENKELKVINKNLRFLIEKMQIHNKLFCEMKSHDNSNQNHS